MNCARSPTPYQGIFRGCMKCVFMCSLKVYNVGELRTSIGNSFQSRTVEGNNDLA